MPTHILIVDDHPDICRMVCLILTRAGYHSATAATGIEALTQWQTARPDAILLDLNLPGLPGWDVCRRIKAASTTPIIVMTGHVLTPIQARQLAPEADGYLLKPFDVQELLTTLEQVLAARPPGAAAAEDGPDPAAIRVSAGDEPDTARPRSPEAPHQDPS